MWRLDVERATTNEKYPLKILGALPRSVWIFFPNNNLSMSLSVVNHLSLSPRLARENGLPVADSVPTTVSDPWLIFFTKIAKAALEDTFATPTTVRTMVSCKIYS
jgi:hypothetical protein